MSTPTVSFVIPCYKLAHLLPECVNSILTQTYADFEVIIMDDCSPDNTPEVIRSFGDKRVKYLRNDENLGHLRNYNKGIQLSHGKYVWLISADDYLRTSYILQRYVQVMERNPQVGYSFCPGVGVLNGRETGILSYSEFGFRDGIMDGCVFLETLVNQNIVIAASVLARRECYECIGMFPLDVVWAGRPVEMGWVGDWYLWCMFALSFRVAYFAEPMVCYRQHELNMTAIITDREKVDACATADIAVPWMMKKQAEQRGLKRLARKCLIAVATEYARQAFSKRYRSCEMILTEPQFEYSLCHSTDDEEERNWVRGRFFEGAGDRYVQQGDVRSALTWYLRAVLKDPCIVKVYGKLALLPFGALGYSARRFFKYLRSMVSSVNERLRRLRALGVTSDLSRLK